MHILGIIKARSFLDVKINGESKNKKVFEIRFKFITDFMIV